MQQLNDHVHIEQGSIELAQPRLLTAEEVAAVAGGPYMVSDI